MEKEGMTSKFEQLRREEEETRRVAGEEKEVLEKEMKKMRVEHGEVRKFLAYFGRYYFSF